MSITFFSRPHDRSPRNAASQGGQPARALGVQLLALVLAVACLTVGASSRADEAEQKEDNAAAGQVHADDFQSLFDGRTLEGWEGDETWFRVEEGAIVAGSLDKRIPHNYFLCTTDQYVDFELRLQAKLIGQGNNAGIQFRTVRVPDSTEVAGYQADMGRAWNRPVWGALYDESRRRKLLADPGAEAIDKGLKPDDWNDMVIRCRGPHIEIFLNGLKTVDYTEMEDSIARSGVIAVQIHGGAPAEAWYRHIRIRPLTSETEQADPTTADATE